MVDFRKETDGPFTLRSDVPFPDGVDQVWGFKGVKVVGVTHEGRQEKLAAFIASPHRHVLIDREPDNPHDPNAVRVTGIWIDPEGKPDVGMLGYLARDDAQLLHERAGDAFLHGRVEVMFKPGGDYGPGLVVGVGASDTLDPAQVDLPWLPEPLAPPRGTDGRGSGPATAVAAEKERVANEHAAVSALAWVVLAVIVGVLVVYFLWRQ